MTSFREENIMGWYLFRRLLLRTVNIANPEIRCTKHEVFSTFHELQGTSTSIKRVMTDQKKGCRLTNFIYFLNNLMTTCIIVLYN